jgi:hemolysin activation/secretion protein
MMVGRLQTASLVGLRLLAFVCVLVEGATYSAESEVNSGADPVPSTSQSSAEVAGRFEVRRFSVQGDPLLMTNAPEVSLDRYTGSQVTVETLVRAASDVQTAFWRLGLTNVCVSIASDRITNGVAVIHAFRGRLAQILVNGKRYPNVNPAPMLALDVPGADLSTNNPGARAQASPEGKPAPGKTNVVRGIEVRHYEVRGDTLLSNSVLASVFLPHIGTNVTVTEIIKAVSDLQMAYRNRGYVTVKVVLPQQQVTNGIVRVRVFEGKLSEITVAGNRYFSSNNVMRALPSLRTNTLVNGFIFQGELDRANANRDRQISPELAPGIETNTSALHLVVKDRLPLHGRTEVNDLNTPNTPTLRVNSSLVYNNLWQLEHALGVQYSFSPEEYKSGDDWNFYDLPLIANYSGYYRMPLGTPSSLEQEITSNPANFGYSEASRQFRLPPPSGSPEANFFASRSTLDTGVESSGRERLFSSDVRTIDQEATHQDLTINEDLGLRLSRPAREVGSIRSIFSAGLDYKRYQVSSFATNTFVFTEYLLDEHGNPLPPRESSTSQQIPTSQRSIRYLPLNFRIDANRPDKFGVTDFSLAYSPNVYHSGNQTNLDILTSSTQSDGFWHVITASLGREQTIYKGWKVYLRADGQWASQPLVSTEQYGIGGLAGVRGYHEGEVFGDEGWRITLEPKTPPFLFARIFDRYPMYLRFSVFMDYGQVFWLDPHGRQPSTSLWGVGGGMAATLGSHWEAKVAAGMALEDSPYTGAGQGRIYFSIDAQF